MNDFLDLGELGRAHPCQLSGKRTGHTLPDLGRPAYQAKKVSTRISYGRARTGLRPLRKKQSGPQPPHRGERHALARAKIKNFARTAVKAA
jgi:hypothetical protein